MTKEEFLLAAQAGAEEAGHPFPDYAACEAALESAFGSSQLAILGHNLFGTKQDAKHPRYETLAMPTKEWDKVKQDFVPVVADWVKYSDWQTCFTDRLAILQRLSRALNRQGQLKYPHYARALAAQDGETFIREVSATWSTDPHRADKVLGIHASHLNLWPTPTTASPDPQST